MLLLWCSAPLPLKAKTGGGRPLGRLAAPGGLRQRKKYFLGPDKKKFLNI